MKKLIAILLALVMLFGMVGCAASGEKTEAPNEETTKAAEAEEKTEQAEEDTAPAEEVHVPEQVTEDEIGGYKIGFYYLPDSDNMGAQYRRALNWIADLTNCEMEYHDAQTWSAEEVTAAVESMVSTGCDGVIIVSGSSPAMFEYLNESGVYYVGLTRSHTEEVAKVADSSEYCCGWMNEAGGLNYAFSYELVSELNDLGCTKIAYTSGSPGVELYDDRVSGIEDAAADFGMEILTSYRGSDYAAGAADIMSSYGSELDGFIHTSMQDSCIAAIEAAGYGGQIKFAQTDPPSDVVGYMESGRLVATAAGNNTFILQMYMQLFNALSGADRLFDEGEKLVPIIPCFVVSGIEEWQQAERYVMGEVPGMLPEEILSLCSHYAPDTTVEEKEALAESWTTTEYWNIESIVERMAPYIDG